MSDQTDQNAEPVIRLEPGGHAPIISYNVPEPTSYSGKVFIYLELPESLTEGVFRKGISLPASPPATLILYAATSMSAPPLSKLSPEGLPLGGIETFRMQFGGTPIPLNVVTSAGLLRMEGRHALRAKHPPSYSPRLILPQGAG